MRVFEIFGYNLNQIRFKDNKEYFDRLLDESGVNYTDISFCFESDFSGAICEKASRLCPELKEYTQILQPSSRYPSSPLEYRFSSLFKDEDDHINLHIKPEQTEAFGTLLKKIPYSINFGFMGVVLDNIKWDNNRKTKGLLKDTDRPIVGNYLFSSYYSDSIRFYKAFDDGNKRNRIDIMIERFPNGVEIESYPNAFSKFIGLLGKPKWRYFECCFSAEESNLHHAATRHITSIIEDKNRQSALGIDTSDTPVSKEERLLDSVTPISGFSPKAVFNKSAKESGFKYDSCVNGRYLYCKKNEHNHSFIIEIINIPFSSFFTASCSAEGYNFTHNLFNCAQVKLKTVEETERFADRLFKASVDFEALYSEELFKYYGETPNWFVV